ncbi:hypothetical protein RJ639_014492 [Escallonia herrerae]|uniref:BZIP domain-containing protein n=1 Tax=Escallonia herrerae TaxID=1293975 RepID=A0AA88VGD5_9ASTE|nr:hypothetical protein RJ639_014492 [Escallonia herrerae]
MVVTESEIPSQSKVDSALQSDQQEQQKNIACPLLGRQSSIYSLTLDEFQHTLCDGGKNFGSMNMDEFLNSIWTAEENQAHAQGHNTNTTTTITTTSSTNNNVLFSVGDSTFTEKGIMKQPSLSRQGSLTLPAPLCRKTVDEVWSEIHKTQKEQAHNPNKVLNLGSNQRQPTFGEMTLEDFLVKAGVVREQGHTAILHQQQQPYGMYQNRNNSAMGPSYVERPAIGLGAGGGAGVSVATLPTLSQSGVGEPPAYIGGKRSVGYQLPAVCYGGRIGNGGGGYGQVQGLGVRSPASPVSSDGMCGNQVDNMNQYGLAIGMRGGRKRIVDGPVEKVVERRQRRMIKNRESAARSRARKQAYTVELEAELNQLKEENAHLKQALAELERKRKQQYVEEVKMKAQSKAQRAKEKLRVMRRNLSCPY